jgi:hypothetical protein
MIIMDAPDGISYAYDTTNPEKQPNSAINIDTNIIFLKLRVNEFAIVWGMVNNEIIKIIPITLIFKTIVRATRASKK